MVPFQSFQFVPDHIDLDGFQWYYSTLLVDNTHLIQIGVKDTKTQDTRQVELKVKGYIRYSQKNTHVWSQGSYSDPAPQVVASWGINDPGFRDCFIMDAVDMGKICGLDSKCMMHSNGSINILTLQRVSVCGDVQMNTAPGVQPYGKIHPYECNDLLD